MAMSDWAVLVTAGDIRRRSEAALAVNVGR